jgi:hypothetical protein
MRIAPTARTASRRPAGSARYKSAQTFTLSNAYIARHWRQRVFSESVKTGAEAAPKPSRQRAAEATDAQRAECLDAPKTLAAD